MISPNGIQAILFDLDGTLRFNRPASFEVFLDHAGQLGVNNEPENRRQVTRWTHSYWAQSPELAEDVAAFDGLSDAFWVNYAERCLVKLGESAARARTLAPEMHRFMKEEHKPEDWVPPETPILLQDLKAAGFRLGVLSNRDHPCNEYLAAVGLMPYLDFSLVAGEVNAWKPDPQIFHYAVQRLGLSPGQVVYIGDNYFADILGAQNAGVHAILLDPDGLFPEAACPIIRQLAELPDRLIHSVH